MARPLTRAQALENAAFLKALRRSGNIREAARATDVRYGTIQHRRRAHPEFALKMAQAIVAAHARLHARGGRQGPRAAATAQADGLRTRGGEPVVVMLKSGQLQVRRAQPGKLTQAAEQAFLLAVSATANISLAAASVGVAEAAFHRRRRRYPAFARELRRALAEGYERLEGALLAGFMPDAHEDDAWSHNEPPAIPPMTAAQALQLMYLHQKEARLRGVWTGPLRAGETGDMRAAALGALYRQRLAERAEDEITKRALTREPEPAPSPHAPAIALPDLAQVTGWSHAKGTEHHKGVALFGGWRIGDLTKAQLEKGRRKRRGWGGG